MKFAKRGEPTFYTEILRITKVIERRSRPVYVLENSNKTPIEGQFYAKEETTYKIDKILNKRVRRGIREYLVRWKGFNKAIDYWIPASSVKDI